MGPTVFRARAQASGTVEETVVSTRGPRMDYGATEVLRGVDITVRRDEVVALPGPDGEGEPTTVGILEGFRRRSAGEVEVLGQAPRYGDERRRSRVSWCPSRSRPTGSGPWSGSSPVSWIGPGTRAASPSADQAALDITGSRWPPHVAGGVLVPWFAAARWALRWPARNESGSRGRAVRERAMNRVH